MYNPFNFKRKEKRDMALNNFNSFVVMSNGKIVPNPYMVDARTALRNSDIYAVVNRISSDVAACSIDCQKPQFYAIDNPNPLQTRFNFIQSIVARMLLNGNAYVTIHRNGSNVPDELEIVPESQVEMLLTDNADDILYTFNYTDGRPQKTLHSADVLHFKLITTGYEQDMYTGRSPLLALADELGIQDQANKLTLNTLLNAINPTTVLKVPDVALSRQNKEAIRDEFAAQTTGNNVGKAIVLDQGLDLSTISINSDVAKFLNNVQFGTAQIAKAFGIPASYLGLSGDAQSSVDMLRSLYLSCLNTYIKPIESEFSKKFGVKVKLNLLDAVDNDNQIKIQNINDLTKNKAISPKQAQQLLANYKILGMDEVVKKLGLQEVGDQESETKVIE